MLREIVGVHPWWHSQSYAFACGETNQAQFSEQTYQKPDSDDATAEDIVLEGDELEEGETIDIVKERIVKNLSACEQSTDGKRGRL